MTAAVQPPYPPTGSAWEEQIVPTLRKRLEQESRILENRLSVHSLTSNSRDEHYQQPTSSSPSTQPRALQQLSQSDSRSPTPSSRVQGNRNYSDTYRQTAIPRPGSSMARDSPYSADRPHTSATSAAASGPSNMSRDGSRSNIAGSGSNRVPFTRSRTRSTPYPFEKDDEVSAAGPNGRRTPNAGVNYGGRHASGTADANALNGIPTPASSRANSPMVMNGKQPSQPPPSKIPQRKRARSSSNSDTPMKASVGRAAGNKIAKRSGPPGQEQITFPPSPETSPDIWRDQPNDVEPPRHLHPGDKIRDEAPPFNPNRLSAAPSFEEREFEHWYRGEGRDGGGRNGGRGEIKVVKAPTQKEMLEIAVGGYDLGADDRWTSSRQRQQAALDTFNMRRREAEQMDYVPHERELSDMEGDHSEDAHDQATGEDPYEYYYLTQEDAQPGPGPSKIPSPPAPTPAPSAIPMAQTQPRASVDSRAQSPSSSASHATHKQVSKAKGHTATSSESSRKGGRPSAAKTPSTPRKSQPRQRAPSRPSNVGGDRPPITADAIPPWAQSPRPPTGGNWDDMVLPAVAKKMGLNGSQPDVTMLGTDTIKQKEKENNQVYEPAAGTFGYDPARRKDETPKRKEKQTILSPDFGDALSLPRPAQPSSPPAAPDFPPRQDSPPPFSSYAIGIHEKEPEPEPEFASAAPSQHSPQSSEPRLPPPPPVSLSKEELKQRGKELRKSRPAIVVTSPSEMATPVGRAGKEDDEGAGCCKCVIM